GGSYGTREHALTCGVPFEIAIRHGRATTPAIGARRTLEHPTPAAARMPYPRPRAVLYPSASIASATSPAAASRIAVAASSRTSSRTPGISRAIASPLPTGKNGSRRPWTTSVGTSISGRRSRQRGLQLSLANTMPSWLAIWTRGAAPGVRSQMRAAIARGDGVVAADLGASGGERGNRLAVGPVGHRKREQALHRRLVVVGEVIVRLAGRHRAGADQGERRERARMVERGHLGDH